MFGTESFGFCALMKSFFSCIALATELKKEEIRVQNAKCVGKRLTEDEFNVLIGLVLQCPYFFIGYWEVQFINVRTTVRSALFPQ